MIISGYFLNVMYFTLEEVTGDWKKVNNEEKELYFLPNIIWVSKTRRMTWQDVWHIWRGGWGTEGK